MTPSSNIRPFFTRAAPLHAPAPLRAPAPLLAAAALILACAQPAAAATETGPAIDEKLGEKVPMDIQLIDEEGKPVRLGDLVDRPTILTLVYYGCANICNVLLDGVAKVVQQMEETPGKEYRIVTVSFADKETPELARQKKANYLKSMKKPAPPEAWRFLTGSPESIRRLTEATGFRYERTGTKDYNHPATLIMLTPEGRVARYLYGVKFLPFDVRLAVLEASEGRTAPAVRKMLLYCFSYDPDSRRYTFDILKVTGVTVLTVLGVFVTFLVVTTRRHRRKAHVATPPEAPSPHEHPPR